MTTISTPSLIQRLAQVMAHLVVAVIALVVIGGATRVMEAGLACPDWPLCFGTFLPGRQMHVQVFLEWFHRLDAFLVGLALLVTSVFTLIRRRRLPRWLPPVCGVLMGLVALQGGLGALTVTRLLPSGVVTSHLALALTLVALLSALTQRLLKPDSGWGPLWWRALATVSVIGVFTQCLLGAGMATSWAAQRCLAGGDACRAGTSAGFGCCSSSSSDESSTQRESLRGVSTPTKSSGLYSETAARSPRPRLPPSLATARGAGGAGRVPTPARRRPVPTPAPR